MNGFSDYHYNEAYRDGGGYICPAQVLSMSFNESDMIYHLSKCLHWQTLDYRIGL